MKLVRDTCKEICSLSSSIIDGSSNWMEGFCEYISGSSFFRVKSSLLFVVVVCWVVSWNTLCRRYHLTADLPLGSVLHPLFVSLIFIMGLGWESRILSVTRPFFKSRHDYVELNKNKVLPLLRETSLIPLLVIPGGEVVEDVIGVIVVGGVSSLVPECLVQSLGVLL